MTLRFRSYGTSGPVVVLLHGGPGAPGTMGGVARGLADGFRVLEPFQREDGDGPLTVARHVEDLDAFLREVAPPGPRALVGSSWGAMLALAWAAAHPAPPTPLALVGCGTFDTRARAEFHRRLEQRRTAADRAALAALDRDEPDRDERLRRMGDLLLPAYAVDPVTADLGCERASERANRETWADALRLQREGAHPAAFAAIRAPVLMLHGAEDPHPGAAVRDSLLPHVPHLEYVEFPRCGHYPWIERGAREAFFGELRGWLGRVLQGGDGVDGIVLRLFGPGDSLDELTRLLHAAYAELGRMGLNFTAVDQDPSVTASRIEGKECWIALKEGRIVGTVTFEPGRPPIVPDFWDGRAVAFLSQLGVEPALRGRGIGGLLLERAEVRARECGAAEIALDTAAPADHLLRLYVSRGYREVGRARWPGKTYESAILSKAV